MEVTNVHSHAITASFLGQRCLIDGCSQRSVKMLSFIGDQHKLHDIFGDIVSYSAKYNICYACCCIDHMHYLELLGHTMVIYNKIRKEIVDSVLRVKQDRINEVLLDCKCYTMIRYLTGIALSEDGVSREEICKLVTKILRYYVENINITTYKNPKYSELLDKNFVGIHDKDAITLFIELKKKFYLIMQHLSHSDFPDYFTMVTNEMINLVQHSKLVHILRVEVYV